MNSLLYFPIGFNTTLTIIGVGFVIVKTGRQSASFTSTYLFTESDELDSGTDSYLAIGI